MKSRYDFLNFSITHFKSYFSEVGIVIPLGICYNDCTIWRYR
mgnify:CR=1 FL=1